MASALPPGFRPAILAAQNPSCSPEGLPHKNGSHRSTKMLGAYAEIFSNFAAVPPRIARLSESLKPGVFRM